MHAEGTLQLHKVYPSSSGRSTKPKTLLGTMHVSMTANPGSLGSEQLHKHTGAFGCQSWSQVGSLADQRGLTPARVFMVTISEMSRTS